MLEVRGRTLIILLTTALIGACGLNAATRAPVPAPSSPEPTSSPRRILFLAPAQENDARFLAAFNGARVSLAVASLSGQALELTWVELPAGESSWVPPDAEGAIIAPGTAADALAALRPVLDVPVVSLAGGAAVDWPVLVADASAIATTMLEVAGPRPCLVASSPGGDVSIHLGGPDVTRFRLDQVVEDAQVLARCTGILWPGGRDGASRLDAALAGSGVDEVQIIGTDAIRDGNQEVLLDGSRILIASSAVDVSTRLDLQSRRFVQDYQSEVGLPPGPFSAEAWDAASLLAQVIDGGGGWPETYSGVGGVYVLSDDGLRETYLYRLVRGEWRSATGP